MAAGDVEVTSVQKETRVVGGRTEHVLRVRICNKRDRKVWIKLADNPWKKPVPPREGTLGDKLHPPVLGPDGQVDPGATRRRALDGWVNPETGDSSPHPLGPRGSPRACMTFEIVYDFEPASTYLDIFCCNREGEPEDQITAHVTRMWNDLQTAWHGPSGPRPTYACVLPLPYPMSMERAAGGPLKVVVTGVEGLPASHELVHAFPGIGTPHTLDMGDRESHAVLVLRQVAPMKGTALVRMHFTWLDPPQVRGWPPRWVEFGLRGGRTFPRVGGRSPPPRERTVRRKDARPKSKG